MSTQHNAAAIPAYVASIHAALKDMRTHVDAMAEHHRNSATASRLSELDIEVWRLRDRIANMLS